jgi:histone-lysine N-methyltransferase SETMAR
VQKSAGKILASIFWDQDAILLTDHIPKGLTINAEYYSSLLVQLKDILKVKRHRKFTNVILFLHNATPHRALATQKQLAYLGFQCLQHQPYSPDLAPLDYYLFPGLKKQLKCCHFSSKMEVIAALETWLERQFSDFFFEWLAKVRATG